MAGLFITFEGTEGCGKSTQIRMLAARLEQQRLSVVTLREPGGTLVGEEIRHTLKHSRGNFAMTSETELLLMNASRAQLVREVIRPSLQSGKTVLCDRYLDSTTAYQGYGRGMPLRTVQSIIDLAVGDTRPDLTFLLRVSLEASEQRRQSRQETLPPLRDRFEEEDREFFRRVAAGYEAIAAEQPVRFRVLDGESPVELVHEHIWKSVAERLTS